MANLPPRPVPGAMPPADVGAILRQADAFWRAGRLAEAEQLCRRILSTQRKHPGASHLLGLVAHSAGHLDAAIGHLEDATAHPRAPSPWHANLAEMLRQRGRLADAERAARKAIALDANYPGALNNLGIVLQEVGKFAESRTVLDRLVALQPNNPEARNNLGNTLKLLGDLKSAQAHWARALELRPNYAEVYSNMSLLFTEQAQYGLAIDSALRAIRINPRLADAYINLATTETARLRYADALRHADALLAFAPNNVLGLAARATSLTHLDRLDEALASARRAVQLDPQQADAQLALANVEQSLGHYDAAVTAYDRAARLPGRVNEKALIAKALLLNEFGRTNDAAIAFDRAVSAYPRSANAWFNRADLTRFKPDDPALAHMQRLYDEGDALSATDRMLLNFALGKAYLDLGDSDRAFHHLALGNAAKRATFHYDSAATATWMRSIPRTFSGDMLARHAGEGAPSDLPIFIVGMPRSGTTLVEQILASHRDVRGLGELRYLANSIDAIGGYPDLVGGLSPGRLRSLGEHYLGRVQPLAQGRRRVVDKMPANMIYTGLIHLMLPGAKIIHARRDPVDTCLSCYTKLFASEQAFTYDLTELGEFHLAYQQLMAHWRSVLPASAMIEIDYESVVDDVEGVTRQMLDWLGLPWDPNCLDFYRTNRAVRTASVNQVRQPIYVTAKGRWRKHAANLGTLLVALGHPESPLARTSLAR
jgi:tetratricopeptide (TPR) repeat protein